MKKYINEITITKDNKTHIFNVHVHSKFWAKVMLKRLYKVAQNPKVDLEECWKLNYDNEPILYAKFLWHKFPLMEFQNNEDMKKFFEIFRDINVSW